MKEDAIHRFYANFKMADGCWDWTGPTREGVGSGIYEHDGEVIDAHRMSYLIHKGPIPELMHVIHTCPNSRCVNPAHLTLSTTVRNQHLRKHPSLTAYQRGCRCDGCRALKSNYYLKRRTAT